jgi:predicted DNA-binding protein
MYIYTSLKSEQDMKRTQIYLDEQLHEALLLLSKLKKKKVSEIIREILREKLIQKKEQIYVVKEASGIWADRDFDTDEYLRDIRSGKRLEENSDER